MKTLQIFLEDYINVAGADLVDIINPVKNVEMNPSSHQTKGEYTEVGDNSKPNTIFTVIKPGFLNKAQDVIEKFKSFGWKPFKTTTKTLTLQQAKELYAVHKKEDFYNDLCEYMSSGPSMAIIYQKKRVLTDVFKETGHIKDEIRKAWGESDMRNVLHSSDSYSNMEKEQQVYF